MNWAVAALLALATFIVIAFMLKAPRAGREAIAAALILGLAGYALQASPGLPGSPKETAQKVLGDPARIIAERQALSGKPGLPSDKWLLIGDALARNGQYGDAAAILLGAVEHDPNNAEAWLAMANALVAHADGLLTPAAFYAFQHAADTAPDHPAPPFFLGLALAQSGRLAEARSLWAELLQRSPADAPWRADLQSRLTRLDELIARQTP